MHCGTPVILAMSSSSSLFSEDFKVYQIGTSIFHTIDGPHSFYEVQRVVLSPSDRHCTQSAFLVYLMNR